VSDILGAFEQAVLLSLVRLEKQAYGRMILKEVQQRLQREVAAGAVYATLDRLEEKRLISSRLGSGPAIRAGRPRRYSSSENAGEGMWHGFRWPLKGRA
jgi:PadR family transcriptional regulator PadR